MPYWAKRDNYTWAWKYLASVVVRDKVYICSKEQTTTRNHGEYQERIAIRLLDRSMGRPEPLEQCSTRINSELKVTECSAVSQEDEIYLLFNIYDFEQEEFGFMLVTYHTVARSWSELTISGPTSPSRQLVSRSCLIGNTIFVYQCDVWQLPPKRTVYALNVETREWSLHHVSSWKFNEYFASNILPWKHYLIGLGAYLYRQERGQFSPVRENQRTVCMFNTTTNTWIVPQTSGDPPLGRDVERLVLYRDKLVVICKQNGGADWASPTIYCFDLNDYAWSNVHYLGTPAALLGHGMSCFCIDNLIYCFRLVCRQPYRTLIDVIDMTTKSLSKQCLEQIRDPAFKVASKTTVGNLIGKVKAFLQFQIKN